MVAGLFVFQNTFDDIYVVLDDTDAFGDRQGPFRVTLVNGPESIEGEQGERVVGTYDTLTEALAVYQGLVDHEVRAVCSEF